MEGRLSKWIPRGPIPALLLSQAVALTILYWPVVSGTAIFFQRDILNYWKPHIDWILKSLATGQTIGWNPGLMFGLPNLADPNFQLFYPPTWLILFVSPPTAYALMVILHAFWGAAGVGCLLRSRGEEKGMVAGALAFSLAGPFVSLGNLWHHYCGASWIPWVLWATDRLVKTQGASWRPLALALGVQALAGSAESVMMSVFLGPLLAVFSRDTNRLAALGRAAVLAFGVCAIQWIPAVILVSDSARSTFNAGTKLYWSVSPDLLYETLIPGRRQGSPVISGTSAPGDDNIRLIESLYLGAATLPFFAIGLGRNRILGALGFLLLVAACGRHLGGLASEILAQVLPFRYPSKLMAGVTVVWSVIAGSGIHRVLTSPAPRRSPPLWVLSLLGVLGLFLLLPDLGEFDQRAIRAVVFVATAVFLVASSRRIGMVGIPLLLMADLLPSALSIHTFSEPAVAYYRPKPLEALLANAKNPRVFAADAGEASVQADLLRRGQPSETAYHIAMSDTLQALAIGHGVRYGYHLDFTGLGSRDAAIFQELAGRRFRQELPRYLNLGAIDAVVSYGGTNPLGTPRGDLEIPGLLSEPIRIDFWGLVPRATIAKSVNTSFEPREALQLILAPGFDPGRDVVIEVSPGSDPIAASDPGPATAKIILDSNDRVDIEAVTTHGGWLVLRDSFRRGWRVSINGVESPIEKADVLFRAVRVPPGQSLVSFRYSTPGLGAGALIGLFSILAMFPRPPKPSVEASRA